MSDVEFRTIQNGDINLRVAIQGSGPLILCVHGWPELWYSWRHQMRHFAAMGYTVAAMDVRGYGGSDKPSPVAAYTLAELAGDAAAVIGALSDAPAILFGHDWGAPIVYATAMLHADKVAAVAGLSVPFRPASEVSLLEVARQVFAERFFYMLYFQQANVPEAEFEADIPKALRTTYYSASADAPPGSFTPDKPRDSTFLDGMAYPKLMPDWMSDADLQVYIDAFNEGGFRGPINRYRAQSLDFEASKAAVGVPLAQPACFIGGEVDPVRAMITGMDMYADLEPGYVDLRVNELVPAVGHWLQQEAPEATNAILERFVRSLV
ncbi:alpha/beta fold hydrolase [Congregibacter variabilis]|uniref:Alpha/beta fold hydrolase n=1 Tax=Congregibacter variabilis TaxID=3081200 RepID=A0ABZ0HZJ4_9GAMM|nr:alpha/beta fold hydrolase [Congregibacter sp. IMCC43200]